MKPIRIAVTDDSSFVRRAVVRLLGEDENLEVVGAAASGEELLANLPAWKPDVVTLDLAMPGMGGLATLDRIMEDSPLPVIIFSTHSGQGAPQTIEALHRGAVDFIDKQRYSLVDFEALREVLVEKILQVSRPGRALRGGRQKEAQQAAPGYRGEAGLLVVGASTGGPPAIQRILEDLGGSIPVPVLVAQHMPEGFTRAFATRLNSHLACAVREAADRELLRPSTVYIAPATYHLTVKNPGDGLRAVVGRRPATTAHRPSADVLFRSAAAALGERVIGLLLTGMGNDGARGMAALSEAGAYTLAQDAASSIVHSMPEAAIRAGAVREVLPLGEIGPRLRQLLTRQG